MGRVLVVTDSSATVPASLAQELGITFRASGATTPRDSLLSGDGNRRPWSQCRRPLSLMYITANGNVLPCCISPFSTVAYASIILGNVFKDSLVEIWSGSRYRNFRKQHQTETPPKCCQGCGVYWSL